MLYYLLAFSIGYAIGRIDVVVSLLKNRRFDDIDSSSPSLLLEKREVKKNVVKKSIDIDDSTYVTQVETDNYVKNFETLGKESVVNDNVSAAVSKLSQLKKK
jgi:hypothetical protein